jgi:hypothetical protein
MFFCLRKTINLWVHANKWTKEGYQKTVNGKKTEKKTVNVRQEFAGLR